MTNIVQVVDEPEFRSCTRCHRLLPIEKFGSRTRNGKRMHVTICRECVAKRARKKYRGKNKSQKPKQNAPPIEPPAPLLPFPSDPLRIKPLIKQRVKTTAGRICIYQDTCGHCRNHLTEMHACRVREMDAPNQLVSRAKHPLSVPIGYKCVGFEALKWICPT